MKAKTFKEANVKYAEEQEEYQTLPALKTDQGQVLTCWSLSLWERLYMLFSGRFWLLMIVPGKDALQPILPFVRKGMMVKKVKKPKKVQTEEGQ